MVESGVGEEEEGISKQIRRIGRLRNDIIEGVLTLQAIIQPRKHRSACGYFIMVRICYNYFFLVIFFLNSQGRSENFQAQT